MTSRGPAPSARPQPHQWPGVGTPAGQMQLLAGPAIVATQGSCPKTTLKKGRGNTAHAAQPNLGNGSRQRDPPAWALTAAPPSCASEVGTHGRGCRVETANGLAVLREPINGNGLDLHPACVRLWSGRVVRGGAGQITHARPGSPMSFEARDETQHPAGIVLCQTHLEARLGRSSRAREPAPALRFGHRARMKIVTDRLGVRAFGKAFASHISLARAS